MKDLADLILTVIAVIGVIGNAYAFLTARIELRAQRKETKELVRLTSDLEHKVHLLEMRLNHKVQRLERLKDLITKLTHITIAMRQKIRTPNEYYDYVLQQEMIVPEIYALVDAVNDEKMNKLFTQLESIYSNEIWQKFRSDEEYDRKQLDEVHLQQRVCTTDIHQRILELTEEVTKQS